MSRFFNALDLGGAGQRRGNRCRFYAVPIRTRVAFPSYNLQFSIFILQFSI